MDQGDCTPWKVKASDYPARQHSPLILRHVGVVSKGMRGGRPDHKPDFDVVVERNLINCRRIGGEKLVLCLQELQVNVPALSTLLEIILFF